MPGGSSNNGTIWTTIGSWVGEIVVVFIGVYLAFLLSGYRTNQQNEQKKQQIYASLHEYFLSFNFQHTANAIDSTHGQPFLKAYEKGEMPRLKPLPFLRSSMSNDTWQAILQAGGIDLLDVNFILQIDDLFAKVRSLRQSIKNFNYMSNQYLLPYPEADISRFYNTKTKKIRPLYEWYVTFLKQTPPHLRDMQMRVDSMLAIIEKRMDKQELK